MNENTSGLAPLGVAVLIKLYEPERRGAQIVLPESVQGRMNMVDNRAVVVEVGPSAWHDEPCPRAKVGDRVLVTKFAGFVAKGPSDGQTYRLVNDRDIFCAITHEEVENA
jgi:co-chaperonin GroES (HSP10)